MALANQKLNVVAINCCSGKLSVDKAAENVCKVVTMAGKVIKIYKGSNCPFVKSRDEEKWKIFSNDEPLSDSKYLESIKAD